MVTPPASISLPDTVPMNSGAPSRPDCFLTLVKKQSGLEGAPEFIGTVSGKLMDAGGVTIAQMKFLGFARRFQFPRNLTAAGPKPDYLEIRNGQWWPSDYHG